MAAVVATKPVSNIAIAFAGKTAFVDIPKPRDSHNSPHSFHAGAGDHANKHHGMLPTPPNSISPTLPPHKGRPYQSSSPHPPTSVDSDAELQDAVDHAASQDQPPQALSSAALAGVEAAGAITPAMLARDHLPNIVLTDGPIAIRNILNCLTQTVPGFSRIAPAKARRVVVGALEGKNGGGPNGEVQFEKVGWGRWDACIKGQPPRERRPSGINTGLGASVPDGQLGISPPASMPDSYAVSQGSAGGLKIPRKRNNLRDGYSHSWGSHSYVSSPTLDEEMEDDMDMHMATHEADKMSLDGSENGSSSSDDVPVLDDLDDLTDEEDWAALGAEALRRGSLPLKSGRWRDYNHHATSRLKPTPTSSRSTKAGKSHHPYRSHQQLHQKPGSCRSASGPSPVPIPPHNRHPSSSNAHISHRVSSLPNHGLNGVLAAQDAQERAAIEALVRMGSM